MAEMHHHDCIAIAAPQGEIWQLRLDFSRLPDYNPNVRRLRRLDDGCAPGVGAVYLFDLESDYGAVACTLRVVSAVPPVAIVNEMDAGILAEERCTLTARSDGGTDVAIDLTVRIPDEFDESVRQLIASVNAEQVRTELVNLKSLLEHPSVIRTEGG